MTGNVEVIYICNFRGRFYFVYIVRMGAG